MTLVRPDGETLHLNQKAIQVLCHLAEHAGEPLTKQQILDAVWPDTHVGDDVLSNAVYELRRALGDNARAPWAIRTIHRRGYQLIAEVQREHPARPLPPEATTRPEPANGGTPAREGLPRRSPTPPRPSRARWAWIGTGLALLVLALARIGLAPPPPPTDTDGPMVVRLGQILAPEGASPGEGATADLLRHLRSRIKKSPHLVLLPPGEEDSGRENDLFLEVDGRLSYEPEQARFEIWIEGGDHSSEPQPLVPIIEQGRPEAMAALVEKTCERVLLELEIEGSRIEGARQGIEESKARVFGAWLHYRDGREARSRNAYDDAIASLRQAVILDPSYAHAHDLLANVYDIVGHREQATEAIERAITAAEGWSEGDRLLLLRRRAQIAGRTGEELSLLRRIHSTDPHNLEWRFKLAWFYKTHERDCAKSEERYKDLFSTRPEGPWYGHWLKYRTDHALACGDPAEAIELLGQQVAASPGADTYDQLAYAQILTGEHAAAEQSLDAARELDPESALTLLLRGKLALARGRLAAAAAAFEQYRATFEWPNTEAEALIHLARVHLATGDDDDALAAAAEAVRRKPWSIEALGVRGLAELRVLGPGVARATLAEIEKGRIETGSESRWEMEHYYYLAGAIALADAHWEGAIAAFGAAVELRPENRSGFDFALARAWQLSGDEERALAPLRRALDFNPRHAPSLCALAELEPEHPATRNLLADQDCRTVLVPPFIDLGPELAPRDEVPPNPRLRAVEAGI